MKRVTTALKRRHRTLIGPRGGLFGLGLFGLGLFAGLFGLGLFGLLAGCKQQKPKQVSIHASELPSISIVKTGRYLLTHYDRGKGTFVTSRGIGDLPSGSRDWVRVVDLAMAPTTRRDHELVYVADFQQPRADGTYPYVVVSRRAFELAAANRNHALASPRGAAGNHGGVVVYGTRWCPACSKAKQWLRDKGIPFQERDVEKDPAAGAELMEKARRAGISPTGVPVIDVKGTLVQGFNPSQIAALLEGKSS